MKHFQQLTFLKVLLPFVVGIFLAIYSMVSWQLPIGIAILVVSLHFSIVKYANTKLKALPHKILGTLFNIAFIALGFYVVDTYRDTNSPLHFQNQKAKYFKIRVDEYPVLKFGQFRFKGKVKEIINEKGEVLPAQGNLLCYWSKSTQDVPQAGMDYWVSTSLRQIEAPKNPDEFNYKQYLSYYNIYYKCYIKDSLQIVKLPNVGSSVKILASQMRLWTQGVYRKHLTEKKYYDLATALILGSKNELDEQITEDFSHTGTLHVLAVSGLHVGIIFLLLTFITKPLAKIKYGTYVQGIICLSGIWVFALLTGFSPSVQRAAIMFSLFSIAQLSKVKGAGINTLLGSAFVMLVYNPFLIVNVGFQLSYCAVLGIMLIHKPIYSLLTFGFINNKILWKIVDWCWTVCCISFAAQLGTFPVSLFYFGQFPTYFLFSNLLVIPCIFFMVYSAIAILATSFVPIVSSIVACVFKGLSFLVLESVKKVAALPFSYANGLHFGFWDVVIVYVIIAFFIAFLHLKKRKYLNYCLLVLVFFLGVLNGRYVNFSKQKLLTLHSIRNHDVITYLDGNTAFLIADSGFINNASAQKFYLSPYFRAHYIKHKKFKIIQSTLDGYALNNDSLKVLIHQTKYPDVRPFLQDSTYTFLLPRNEYNQKLIQSKSNKNVIWKYQSPYALPIEDNFHKLDSFAFSLQQK